MQTSERSWPSKGPLLNPTDSKSQLLVHVANTNPGGSAPALLASLITSEIVGLMGGPHGPQLQLLVAEGSPSHQIAKAVSWLKHNFSQPTDINVLADRVHMRPSTFRQHFRSMTGTCPIQYQKPFSLQQARQLMLSQRFDAASASGLAHMRARPSSAASTTVFWLAAAARRAPNAVQVICRFNVPATHECKWGQARYHQQIR